jgi:hypothetical protein
MQVGIISEMSDLLTERADKYLTGNIGSWADYEAESQLQDLGKLQRVVTRNNT